MVYLSLLVGLLVLVIGAELLVRGEGGVMLMFYVTYTALLIADSQSWALASEFKSGFAYVVFPAMCVVCSLLAWRGRAKNHLAKAILDAQ